MGVFKDRIFIDTFIAIKLFISDKLQNLLKGIYGDNLLLNDGNFIAELEFITINLVMNRRKNFVFEICSSWNVIDNRIISRSQLLYNIQRMKKVVHKR
jgi:hypothetical protein